MPKFHASSFKKNDWPYMYIMVYPILIKLVYSIHNDLEIIGI